MPIWSTRTRMGGRTPLMPDLFRKVARCGMVAPRSAHRGRQAPQTCQGEDRCKTEGVSELKVDAGPGYRVYYSQRGERLLLLIAGGDKSSQDRDIAMALELNRNFVESSS